MSLFLPGSNLRVWVHTDPAYADFIERSELREVLGLVLPVASLEDVLTERVWAASLAQGNALRSKHMIILLDIARILDVYPELSRHVPQDILDSLFGWGTAVLNTALR